MKFVYFAWVRERIGKETEDRDLPADLKTVEEVLAWLETQGDEYAHALGRREDLRIAVNMKVTDLDGSIENAEEIAIFPPMTGG